LPLQDRYYSQDFQNNFSYVPRKNDSLALFEQIKQCPTDSCQRLPSFETDNQLISHQFGATPDNNTAQQTLFKIGPNTFESIQAKNFPINSFPLSTNDRMACPECAAGKAGHFNHIKNMKGTDDSMEI